MGEDLLPTIVHEDDQAAMFAHLHSLRRLPVGTKATLDYRVKSKQGDELWLRSIDSVFDVSAEGTVLRHIGIAVDITAQKQIEARLIETNETLEARVRARTQQLEVLNSELGVCMAQRTAELNDVNRDLKDLTYVATHDLKVPVNNMISLTHMLSEAEEELPAEHAETLSWMHEACHQAGEKLDALICVAQAHSGTFGEFKDIDLRAVTERALLNLHFQITKAKAVIAFDFEAPTVWFVPREIENILQSMIGNAIRYRAPERRPRIRVQSRQLADAVEVSIIDNGSGVNLPQDQEKVFGLFKCAHSTPDGAGVSLYAIRRVLDRVGGSLHATSEVGRGSCFSFRLALLPKWCEGVPV